MKRFKGWKNEMWEAKRETAKSQFLGVQTQTRQSSLHLLHKKLKSLKGQSWWELGYNCLLYELPFHVWKHSWLVCAVGSIHCLLSIMSKVATSNSWCQPTDEHEQNIGYKTGNLQLDSTSEPCGWFILTRQTWCLYPNCVCRLPPKAPKVYALTLASVGSRSRSWGHGLAVELKIGAVRTGAPNRPSSRWTIHIFLAGVTRQFWARPIITNSWGNIK